jgi:tRNA G10  N-methylase Trm11
MKYLFILGRNPELSVAEIFAVFKKNEIKILNSEQIKNALLIELEKEIPKNIINILGGTISIGKVLCSAIPKEIEKQNLYFGTSNKLNYCLWDFSVDNIYKKIAICLKKIFKSEKLKATQKNLNGLMELQDGKYIRISSGLIDEEYFIFNNEFGRIIEKTDYKKLEERDMNKPDRRESLAISPRLAKILINLSLVKNNERLIDPFCGIGIILQEALLQNVKVIGIDNDKEAIIGAEKNLSWFHFNKENYFLINNDSRKVKIKKVDVLVAEPDLGETLKKQASNEKARKILKNFEDLIIDVLNNLKNSINGRIVFTSPYIKLMNNNRVGCDIEHILKKTNLRVLNNFSEYRKDQVVGRNIFVLSK